MKCKVCHQCGEKNVSYTSTCEKCGANINHISATEIAEASAASTAKQNNEGFCLLLGAISWASLIFGVAGGVFILVT